MKKLKEIVFLLALFSASFAFTSCQFLAALFTDVAEVIGDPVSETCFFNCGISHGTIITGYIDGEYCRYIKLLPMEKRFEAYNEVNGTRVDFCKGTFFYQENLKNTNQGILWISVSQYWDEEKGKWVSPNTEYYSTAENRTQYFNARAKLF